MKLSSIGYACLIPEFAKVRSEVNVDLIKLRAVQKLCINLIYHRVTVQVIL